MIALFPLRTLLRIRPVLFAAVWGLVPAELERVVARIQTSAAQAGVHPVFLTDCARLEILRAHRALFEYLPPMEELARLAPTDDALLYLVRRLELLRRKWQPVRIVAPRAKQVFDSDRIKG